MQKQQNEVLFNELNTLIQREGFPKAIITIKLINSRDANSKKENTKDIELYHFIAESIANKYGIDTQTLFNGDGRGTDADARRSAYVFISLYLGLSSSAIAKHFKKDRSTISRELKEFDSMKSSPTYYKHYLGTHDEIAKMIDDYILD